MSTSGESAGTRLMAAPSSIVIVNRLFLFSVDESGRRERITISFGLSLLSPLANRRFASSPIALSIGLRRGRRTEAEGRGASHFGVRWQVKRDTAFRRRGRGKSGVARNTACRRIPRRCRRNGGLRREIWVRGRCYHRGTETRGEKRKAES